MDYKAVLLRVKNMVLSPAKEWEDVKSNVPSSSEAISMYAIPVIGLLSLASFLGVLINNQGVNFQFALVEAIVTFCGAYFSIYVAGFILGELHEVLAIEKDKQAILKYIPFAYSVFYLIIFITELIPELFFIKILILYTVYLVWEQASVIFNFEENDRVKYTAVYSLVILAVPALLFKIMTFLVQNVTL